jgi:hypothetical protein
VVGCAKNEQYCGRHYYKHVTFLGRDCERDGERTVGEWYDNYWELLEIIENY